MNKIEKIINDKYNEYDEDTRLHKDKSHELEFITTTSFIEKYLNKNAKILEIGAGTGAYSIYYAKKGYDVSSVELVDRNLEVLNKKITPDMNIKTYQGNAVNLDMFDDGIFDLTLCLGPLYHLFDIEGMNKAISECVRVTKPGGIIFLAYIPNDVVMINWLLRKNKVLDAKDYFDNDFNPKNNPDECFSVWKFEQFNNIMKDYKVEFLENVGVSGLSIVLNEYVNALSEEEFSIWVDYHLKTCTNTEILGYNSEIIYICRKEK